MLSRLSLAQVWLALLVAVQLGCTKKDKSDPKPQQPEITFDLTDEEIRVARELAERGLKHLDGGETKSKTYFIKAELLPGSQADATALRQVMVINYRYEGDETIETCVDFPKGDLTKAKVVSVKSRNHVPTGLAPEEAKRAEELARGDQRLTALFEKHGDHLTITARPFETDPGHPRFGRRNVKLYLQAGTDYLAEPLVTIDLNPEKVYIETSK